MACTGGVRRLLQPGHPGRERTWSCSMMCSICLAARARRTFGALMTASTGSSCRLSPNGGHDGYGTAVFGSKLWVYGGWKGQPTNALNDIWYSTGGESWVRQAEHAPWGPRSPRTIVYKDKLWIFSGKHTGGRDNWGGDIWTMSLPQ